VEVTIRDKKYTDRFLDVLLAEQIGFVAEELGEKREEWKKDRANAEKRSAYENTWLEFCRLQLNEPVEDLALSKISPKEMVELNRFFGECSAMAMGASPSGKETSEST
jgi:hypothetical protein